MKSETRKRKLWRQKIIIKLERRRLRKRHSEKKNKRTRVNWFFICAPIIFDISERHSRKKVIDFNAKLRTSITLKRFIVIDFTPTQKMVAEGTLLFKAELDRLLRIFGYGPRIRCRPPASPKVAQVLEQVGIYDLLKYHSHVSPCDEDVVCWRYTSGEGAIGEEYEKVLGDLDERLATRVQTGLYDGIVEAMTNANHHAYEQVRYDGLDLENSQKKWWMFSQVRDDRLSVCFCDLGIGIPRSLPLKRTSVWEKLWRDLGRQPGDGEMIKAAVDDSRSRTGQKHRGKGLKQLVAAVDRTQTGILVIHSNAGRYFWYKRDTKPVEQHVNYRGSILGTLISWSVPLTQEERRDAT